MLRRSPAPARRRAVRQHVQAFCRRQNLAPGRIHSAPAEIKSGAPGRREPDGAELRRGDRQAAGQVNSGRFSRAGHLVSGPSACRKSLAEFAHPGAKKLESVFSGDMCVGENTSQAASVGFVRLKRTNPARGGLHPSRKSGFAAFSTHWAGHSVSGPFFVPGLWRGGLSAIM